MVIDAKVRSPYEQTSTPGRSPVSASAPAGGTASPIDTVKFSSTPGSAGPEHLAPSWKRAGTAAVLAVSLLTGAAVPASAAPLGAASEQAQQGSVVTIARTSNGFALMRNGKPFLIKGGAGDASLDTLVAIGGNSVRTYGVGPDAQARLDAAQKAGVALTQGIWLGHQSYMDYTKDSPALQQQRKMVEDAARRYKDHPALLMWGLGNEMETGGDAGNPAMWKEIDRLAQTINSIDPNHPVMTVVAEISPEKVAAIKKYAPHVDVLGINAYGSAASLPQRLKKFGWDKPYAVTEFGPKGFWEVPKTPWGSAYEPSSTEKEDMYRRSWEANVTNGPGSSLGAYPFAWGHKWETTATWFGMFLPQTEEKLGAVDVMTALWGGKPANPVPTLTGLSSDARGMVVAPSSKHEAHVLAADPQGTPLTYRWEIRPDPAPGAPEPAPVHDDTLAAQHGPDVAFVAPVQPGPYRLYTYVADGHGGAATANVPFYVGPAPAPAH